MLAAPLTRLLLRPQSTSAAPPSEAVADESRKQLFSKLELRVGEIVKVWAHPTADRLWCEEIDVGEAGGDVRQIASGLRQVYSEQQMLGVRSTMLNLAARPCFRQHTSVAPLRFEFEL